MDYNTMKCPLTLNTTRICGENPVDISIVISRISFNHMKPNAVILVNKNEVFDGIAASSLVHIPIDAPILLIDGKKVSKETLLEIKRLNPKGYKGIHVFLVGNISKNVEMQLNSSGLRTQHITGRNHYETACNILKERKDFNNVIIMSGEDYSEGIASAYYAAHHGNPILFVRKDIIPSCTIATLKKLQQINVYIIGSTKTVSKAVEEAIEDLNNISSVNRITGDTHYSIAVNFTKYKDDKTEFGWGRDYREGHAFTFGTLSDPMDIIPGVVFAHMGKHTPLLLIKDNCVPQVVEKYIEAVKPIPPKDMPRPPFMHGFILGNVDDITYDTQIKVEEILSIDHHMMMEMEDMDHMMHHKNHHMHHHMMGMEGMHPMNCEHKMEDMNDEDDMDHMMMHHDKHHHMHHHMMGMGGMHPMNCEHEMEDMNDEDDMDHMMMHHDKYHHMHHHMHHHMMGMEGMHPMNCEHKMEDMNDEDDMDHMMMHHMMMHNIMHHMKHDNHKKHEKNKKPYHMLHHCKEENRDH
jgi:putative cell wall-binding protein